MILDYYSWWERGGCRLYIFAEQNGRNQNWESYVFTRAAVQMI